MRRSACALLVGIVCMAVSCRSARVAHGAVLDDPTTVSVVRLRPAGHIERLVVAEGLCGSATFRSLVETIERSDLVVHVSMRWLGDRRLSGRLDFLTATATQRVLRATLGLPLDRVARIAVLGHELQHASEVAGAPDIRTRSAFAAYYREHGRPGGIEWAYDTDAARQVETQIRMELARSAPCAPIITTDDDRRPAPWR